MLDVWHAGDFELLLSDRQQIELTDVFSRPKIVQHYQLVPQRLNELFRRLAAATPVVPHPTNPVSPRDPKDEHILAAALGGNADYLVTGDDDPLVHQGDPRLGTLKIVTAAQFLVVLDKSSAERAEDA